MDFFAQQERARRITRRLVVAFVLATAGITLAVYLVTSVAFGFYREGHPHRDRSGYLDQSRRAGIQFRLDVLAWVSLGTMALIGIGTLWRMNELRSGGTSIATSLGGRHLSAGSADAEERRLMNVVEEMAIASGVPVPQVYVLDQDSSINAFAAGHTTGDAVIGVTRGCLRTLNRDELQGVIAHEFSHILNGDMRLNLNLVAWIFGIMGLALVGRVLLYARGDRKNPLPLLGLALMLIGWCGVFFGRLIQSGVSRQREFLADASAVQFTRNPDGLAGALRKIGGLAQGSLIASPQAAEVSHMFFANGLKASFMTPFATHPPLEERIRALDPAWDGKFAAVRSDAPIPPVQSQPQRRPMTWGGALPGAMAPLAAGTIIPRIGQPSPMTLQSAANWRASLPASIEAAAQEPLGTQAIVFALLLSEDAPVREQQLGQLQRLAGPSAVAEAVRLHPQVAELARRARLPLVDLAMPVLREMSQNQFQVFDAALAALIKADRQVDLFEYTLQKIVHRHLAANYAGSRRTSTQHYALPPLLPDCGQVLKLIAQAGASSRAEAEAAWAAGWRTLQPGEPAPALPYPAADDLSAFDRALNRLELAAPNLKRAILTAAAEAAAADGILKEAEAELIRAVGDTLDCPIPPFAQLTAT